MSEAVKEIKYTDGDPDLLNALKELTQMKEAGAEVPDQQFDHINALLQSDINHRIRIQADYEKASAISDQVTLMGTVIEVPCKTTGIVGEVNLPYGLLKSSLDLINDVNDGVAGYLDEVTGEAGLAKHVADMMAPVYQRLLLADAALLELRKFYTLNMNFMAPRTTGHLAEIVARAETATNGAFGSFIAAMNGYDKDHWNYGIVPAIAGTGSRKLKVYANGTEAYVKAWNFMSVENQPHPSGGMMVVGHLDEHLLQLVTTECQVIPVYAISCWRDVTEEEAALDIWTRVDDVYESTKTAYEMVLKQQASAKEEKKGPKLILPETAQEGNPGLILPQ